jgi:peptide deformylase
MIKSMVYDLIDYDSAILEQELPLFDFNNPPVDPQELAKNLLETMRHHRGIGLSANQVGLPYRVFVMEGDPPFACFNPKIVDVSQEIVSLPEGCLSYPGVNVPVKRPAHVRVRFSAPDGNVITKKFTGMTARVFLHEHDHLQGVNFLRKMHPVHKEKALRQLKKYTRYLKNQQR